MKMKNIAAVAMAGCMAASLAACVPAAVAWTVVECMACSEDSTADLLPSRAFGTIPAA